MPRSWWVLAALSGACLTPQPAAAESADPGPQVAFNISDPRIDESSGLAASTQHPGVVYTHNDSGGKAQIYAIGPDGRTKATLTIAGAKARDWEAIALGRDDAGRPALYVADIGDNMGGAWPYVTVYRVPEPATLRDQTLRATAFRVKYEDGPRNAESMLIHPGTGRLYIASKVLSGALYEAPERLSAGHVNVLRKVGDAPMFATDGAFAPDGRTFVIRTYYSANIYTAPGKLLRVISLPSEKQGESVTYSGDGKSLLVGSEGENQPVWQVPLPSDAQASPSSTPVSSTPVSSTDAAEGDDGGGSKSEGSTVGFLVVAGLVAAAIVVFVRRQGG